MNTLDTYLTEINSAMLGWEAQDYSERCKLFVKRILVLSDAHLPYIDKHLLAEVRRAIQAFQPERVVWLGDLCDMHQFSQYAKTEHTLTWQQEKRMISNILLMVQRDLDVYGGAQVVSRGNHDHRWIKKLDDLENMEGLLCSLSPEVARLVGEGLIEVSDNPTVEAIPDVQGKMQWLLTHPAQFSRSPFSVANALTVKAHMSVLTAHSHHFGYTRSTCGRYWTVEGGGLFNSNAFQYVQWSTNSMRRMAPGFWLIQDGCAPLGFSGETGVLLDMLARVA